MKTSPKPSSIAIESERSPSDDDLRAVTEGLLAFNEARLGPANHGFVTIFARDAEGRVVGGLLAEHRWRWLYVQKLWVDDRVRGQGVGSRLLDQAERDAEAAGCTDVYLDTFSFQARPFYEQLGYTVYATLEGYPPGHRQFYLRKALGTARA